MKMKLPVVNLAMPEMDGIQTAKALQSSADIPVIFLSAYDNESYRNRAVDEHLNVEQWIDKDPSNSVDRTITAVSGVLGRKRIGSLVKELNIRLSKLSSSV